MTEQYNNIDPIYRPPKPSTNGRNGKTPVREGSVPYKIAPPTTATMPPSSPPPLPYAPPPFLIPTAPRPAPKESQPVKIARIVSLVLHPFLISPLSIVLILWLELGNLWAALGWASLCAAFVVGPAMLYLRDKLQKKQFTDADVSVREDRYGFYLFGGVSMTLCFAVLLWLNAPIALIAGFTAALCALVVAGLVNRLGIKVSIHLGAMTGVTAAAAFYSIPLAVGLALGTALLFWARLVTGRHTPAQALAACLIAAVCVAGVFGPMVVG